MRHELPGGVAVMTGAGSGIGRATALALARRGMTLALCDRDPIGLAESLALVERVSERPTQHLVDVGDEAAMNALARDVIAAHGKVSVLVNNAGVALFGSVAELTTDEIAWLMQINFWGTVFGTKAFLPTLLAQPDACIVNISSVFGLFGPPGQSAYAASKFAVRGFSESLRGELARTNVDVCVVHPGGIKTAIARSARVARAADPAIAAKQTATFERQFLTTTPETVANAIVAAIEGGKPRVIVGSGARLIDLLTRIVPTRAAAIIARR